MSYNRSIFLTGIFFVVVLIFGNIFWQMFSGGEDKDFELTKKAALNSLEKKQPVLPVANDATASANSDVLAKADPKNQTEAAESAQILPQEDAQKSAESEAEKNKDETEAWKIFKDEKNKFELKYPNDANIVPSGDLTRVSQNGKTWKFRIFSNKDKYDLQAWYEDIFSEKERKNCVFSESTLKVGSYETKYANPNSGEAECGKAGYFAISTNKESVVRAEIGEETVENVGKILATFKFLTE